MTKKKKELVKVVTWSTEKVEQWKADAENGIIKGKSPYFKGGDYRRANVPFMYTKEEIAEIYKCKNDIIYYAETYCYIMTGTQGYKKVKLFPYQKKMLKNYMQNRFNVVLTSRQMGKTVTASIFLLWYSTFHAEKTVGLLSNKAQSAEEIADKIREIMQRIPYFLQPGVVNMSSKNIKFDNGSRIVCQGTTKNSFIGFTVHVLYCDEFAHVQKNLLDNFYENAMPTISSMSDSKIIITSTPNGLNRFYHIYNDACHGENSYVPIRVDWWERPGRDGEWMKATLKDVGGEASFMRQYGNSFMDSGYTLLGPRVIELMKTTRKFVWKVFDSRHDVPFMDEFRWDPDFNPEELNRPDKRFLLSVDIAEGSGKDSSVIQIFDVSLVNNNSNDIRDKIKLTQCGYWKSNEATIKQMAEVMYYLSTYTMLTYNHMINIEWNKYGELLYTYLFMVDGDMNQMESSSIINYNPKGAIKGITLTKDSKASCCQDFKQYECKCQFVIQDADTVGEFANFSRKEGSSSYAAITGHDDMAMSCVTAAAAFDNKQFQNFVEDLIDPSVDNNVTAFNYDLMSYIDKATPQFTAPTRSGSFSYGGGSW